MRKKRSKTFSAIAGAIALVFAITLAFLFEGSALAARFDVIGIRVATLFIAILTFCSTSMFSLLIYNHNNIVRANNEDANSRAELFRAMQFVSDNYSIINFKDHMDIEKESVRYINKYVQKSSFRFHMPEKGVTPQSVFENAKDYKFFTLKIPYAVVEGKLLGNIIIEKIKFERDGKSFEFFAPETETEFHAFLLFDDSAGNNIAIINLVCAKDSEFFTLGKVNEFSKIKITLKLTSLLGVEVNGVTELYFTNPEHKETDGSNKYKINSSIFYLSGLPKIKDFSIFSEAAQR